MNRTISLLLVLALMLSFPLSAAADNTAEQGEEEARKAAWEDYLLTLKPAVDVAEGCYYTIYVFDDGSVLIPGIPTDGTGYYGFDLSDWQNIDKVATTYIEDVHTTVGLRKDGTVVNARKLFSCSDWKNIKQISCSGDVNNYRPDFGIVGLCNDGTVIGSGVYSYYDFTDEQWTDLKAVCACGEDVIGLRNDGTLVQTGNQFDFSNWKQISALSSDGNYIAGLCNDGTVILTENGPHWNQEDHLKINQWRNVKTIAASSEHLLVLCEDGSVKAAGQNTYGECDVENWSNIVSIAAGYRHSAALCEDGTVLATGDNTYGQCNVDAWKKVTAIAAMRDCTVGLLEDGTIVTTSEEQELERGDTIEALDLSDWQDIAAIETINNSDLIVGIHSDGTVTVRGRGFACWYDLANWKNMKEITAGVTYGYIPEFYDFPAGGYIAGVQEDGRVLLLNGYGGGWRSRYLDWSDIVSVSSCSRDGAFTLLAGLKADGSVEVFGTDDEAILNEVSEWKDMVFISAELGSAVIGVHSDGTVSVTGKIDVWDDDDLLGKEIEGWTDIAEIHACHYPKRVIGLKTDGTVIAAGSNDYGECDVGDWCDIVKVITGYNHTIGIDKDGKIRYTGEPPYEFP